MSSIRKIAAIVAMTSATVAGAHHSFAPHFDIKKPVSISGKVTEFEARNPHSYLHVAAVDENVEAWAAKLRQRRAIRPSFLNRR